MESGKLPKENETRREAFSLTSRLSLIYYPDPKKIYCTLDRQHLAPYEKSLIRKRADVGESCLTATKTPSTPPDGPAKAFESSHPGGVPRKGPLPAHRQRLCPYWFFAEDVLPNDAQRGTVRRLRRPNLSETYIIRRPTWRVMGPLINNAFRINPRCVRRGVCAPFRRLTFALSLFTCDFRIESFPLWFGVDVWVFGREIRFLLRFFFSVSYYVWGLLMWCCLVVRFILQCDFLYKFSYSNSYQFNIF